MNQEDTWLILGSGSLGRLLATHLAGHVPLALAGRQASDLPLTLVTPEGEARIRSILRISTAQAPSRPAMVHLTTKAYAAEQALAELASVVSPATPLVLWQNGYQVQAPLTRRWTGPVLCATTTEGAYTDGAHTVVHAGHGQTYIGHLEGEHQRLAEYIASMLTTAGLPTKPCEDIQLRMWQKLAVNAAINPLVARWRIRNGQLRDRPFRHEVDAVIAEVATIMDAVGIAPPQEGWARRIWAVVEGTANNRASMFQDILAGRPTERDAILGPLLGAAERHGLASPCLARLNQELERREADPAR